MYRETLDTVRRGLDRQLFPMQLWQKAKKLGTWNPTNIDFSQDVSDWRQLDEREKDLLLRLSAQFQAGEEAVTIDLLPLLMTVADQGRIEEEMFLTSYLWEEAKHVDGFSRFLEEVTGSHGELERFITPAYQQIFFEEQPRAMNRLLTDRSPEALADAAVAYQMITEGVLAETGYHAYYTVLDQRDILPGMKQFIGLVQRDESRHIAYGVFLLSRLVAEFGEALWDRIEARLNRLMLIAIQHIGESLLPYGDDIPFGIEADDFVDFGMSQFQKRYARIESARHRTLEEVLYGRAARVE